MIDPEPPTHPKLAPLLDAMRPRDGDIGVTVEEVLGRIGDRSFAAAILVLALLMVSPVSGIPGTPTLSALIILTIVGQVLTGRGHLWLPGVVMRRGIRRRHMQRAVNFLEGPVAWIDRHSHGRLHVLTHPPLRALAYLGISAIAATWPFLELLPFVTSFGAVAVSLIAVGLVTRDGAYLVSGYAVGGALIAAEVTLLSGLLGD